MWWYQSLLIIGLGFLFNKMDCKPAKFNGRTPKLSLADWSEYRHFEPEGPGTYAFGYDIEDAETYNVQFRNEERLPNGTVVGSYGYIDSLGVVHKTTYIADQLGYRATYEKSDLGQLKPLQSRIVTPNQPLNPIFPAQQQQQQILQPTKPIYISNVINSNLLTSTTENPDPIWPGFNENWFNFRT